MTYRIEITADTTSQLAGKLLALAAQFQTVPVAPDAAPVARKTKAAKPSPEAAPEPQAEVAPEPAEPDSIGQPEAPLEVAPEEIIFEPEIRQTAPEVGDTSVPDFDKEMTPAVIAVVEKCGKATLLEILDRFGVSRASQVEPHLQRELLNILLAELEG